MDEENTLSDEEIQAQLSLITVPIEDEALNKTLSHSEKLSQLIKQIGEIQCPICGHQQRISGFQYTDEEYEILFRCNSDDCYQLINIDFNDFEQPKITPYTKKAPDHYQIIGHNDDWFNDLEILKKAGIKIESVMSQFKSIANILESGDEQRFLDKEYKPIAIDHNDPDFKGNTYAQMFTVDIEPKLSLIFKIGNSVSMEYDDDALGFYMCRAVSRANAKEAYEKLALDFYC